MEYAEQPRFGKWVEEQLLARNWKLQQLVDRLESIGTHRSDDYIAQLMRGQIRPLSEDLSSMERVFEKPDGLLTNTSNAFEEELWPVFNEEFEDNFPYERAVAWDYVRKQMGNRDFKQSAMQSLRLVLDGLLPSSGRQAIGECQRCGSLLYPHTTKCKCGLMYGSSS